MINLVQPLQVEVETDSQPLGSLVIEEGVTSNNEKDISTISTLYEQKVTNN